MINLYVCLNNLPKDGYFVIQYEKGALSFKEDGYVSLSQTSIKVKTNCLKESITMVRIVPMGNHFVIEVLYDIKKPEIDETDFHVLRLLTLE